MYLQVVCASLIPVPSILRICGNARIGPCCSRTAEPRINKHQRSRLGNTGRTWPNESRHEGVDCRSFDSSQRSTKRPDIIITIICNHVHWYHRFTTVLTDRNMFFLITECPKIPRSAIYRQRSCEWQNRILVTQTHKAPPQRHLVRWHLSFGGHAVWTTSLKSTTSKHPLSHP